MQTKEEILKEIKNNDCCGRCIDGMDECVNQPLLDKLHEMDFMENTKQEIIDHHVANVKRTICWWPDEAYRGKGGQTVSLTPSGTYLESPDTGFAIFVNSERSNLKNFDLAVTLFRLYLDETIKI